MASVALIGPDGAGKTTLTRMLEDSGLRLKRPPRPPAPVLFIHLATPTIPQIWQQYLPGSATAA